MSSKEPDVEQDLEFCKFEVGDCIYTELSGWLRINTLDKKTWPGEYITGSGHSIQTGLEIDIHDNWHSTRIYGSFSN